MLHNFLSMKGAPGVKGTTGPPVSLLLTACIKLNDTDIYCTSFDVSPFSPQGIKGSKGEPATVAKFYQSLRTAEIPPEYSLPSLASLVQEVHSSCGERVQYVRSPQWKQEHSMASSSDISLILADCQLDTERFPPVLSMYF